MDFNTILTQKKIVKSGFDLFLSNYSMNIMNNSIGMPIIPLIGKYSKDGYDIDEVKGLIILSIQNDCFSNELIFFFNNSKYKISLPKEIKTLISLIPEKIPHNKPSNKPQQQKNNKNNNYNYSKKPEIFDFHPFKFFPLPLVKFVWSISFGSKFQELYPKKKVDNFKNIINHTWVFEEFDFSIRKKLINNIPCCVVIPPNIEKSCGVQMYLTDNKGINFGSFRSEYLSTHLIQGSLCLSPNNMRIILDSNQILSHFWSVYLKTKQEHMVVYHWVFNEMEDVFQAFLKESSSINEFLNKSADILSESHEAIRQIKDLFL